MKLIQNNIVFLYTLLNNNQISKSNILLKPSQYTQNAFNNCMYQKGVASEIHIMSQDLIFIHLQSDSF